MSRILVVDDTRTARRVVRGILNDNCYEFIEAQDGRDALNKLEETVPDVVITDLVMPGMDGLELVSIARDRYPNVPVILMTSHGSEKIAQEALRVGAVSYVPKDELRQHLPPTVERLLELTGAQTSPKRLFRRLLKSHLSFELENDPSCLPPLINFLQDGMNQVGTCDPADVTRVSVALDEALSNAIFHGNLELSSELRVGDSSEFYELAKQRQKERPYQDRYVRVDVELQIDEAKFVISDEGPGFDFQKLPDPRDSSNLDKLSGRGVMLMRVFMDEVSYNDVGNSVTLVKRRSENQCN
jgi:CheY-like chemotaxis protein